TEEKVVTDKNNVISEFVSSNTSPFNSNKGNIYDVKSTKDAIYIYNMNSIDEKFNEMFSDVVLEVIEKDKKVYLHSKNDLKEVLEFDMVFDNNSNAYKLIKAVDLNSKNENLISTRAGSWACNTMCGINAVLISLADGPAPFMDVLALAYAAACAADCASR
ncbi:hypothetical protein, partial [Myroides odoratimimus]|uniref:hypothetical protein n=1 Tax=Myroides odoratimimus TaxID=76832 RepID=UPI00055FDA3D